MRILSAHIDGYGKFVNKDFDFSDGVNVIYGHNEAGKSTLHNFIEAVLLGSDKKSRGTAKSVYDSMRPWNSKVPYKGYVRILNNGQVFRVCRDFSQEDDGLSVYDETASQFVENPSGFLSVLMLGLTSNALRNTVFIGQLSAKTGASLAKELRSFVDNVGSTQNPELSAEAALMNLEAQRSELAERLVPEAEKEYNAALSRIKTLEAELADPANDNRVTELANRQTRLNDEISYLDAKLLCVEEDISQGNHTLSDHHIRYREDVADMDAHIDSLYSGWLLLKDRKASGWRIACLCVAVVGVGLSVAGLKFLANKQAFIIMLAVCAALIVIFALLQLLAVQRFNKKDAELCEYMKSRSGDTYVSEETVTNLRTCIHQYDDLLLKQETNIKEKESLQGRRSTLFAEKVACSEEVQNQQNVRLLVENRLSEVNDLKRKAAELRSIIYENNRIREKLDAIDVAIETITNLSESIRDRMGTYLNDEASKILYELTDGAYHGVEIGTGADMTLNTKDGMISFSDVSAGTIDQIYLSVRLAAARFMMGGKDELPLFFDDSFTLYDDERLKNSLNYVMDSYRGQILVFTCHHREMDALAGRDYTVVEL